MSTFTERLIELKTKNNLLQKDIAKGANLALRSYQYYEKAEREPTMSVLIKLADYFDVSLDYLVGRSSDSTRH